MKRRCGCPFVSTKPEIKKTTISQKTEIKTVPRRSTRVPLQEVQNHEAQPNVCKKDPTPKISKHVETQTSIKKTETAKILQAVRLKSKSTSTCIEVPSFDLPPGPTAKSTPNSPPSVLRATLSSIASFPIAQTKSAEKILTKNEVIPEEPQTKSLDVVIKEDTNNLENELFTAKRSFPTPENIASVSSSNSGFISASVFFEIQERKFTVSPIQPSSKKDNEELLTQFENKLARKKTLTRAKRSRLEKYCERSPYSCDIFTTDYLAEIMQHLLTNDQEYIVKRNFFHSNNNHFSKKQRTIVLDWILSVQFQEELPLSNNIYFMIVRLLDNVLAMITVPYNMLQLVTVAIYWIFMKIHGTFIPNVKKLAYFCANTYSVKEILSMEKKILKLINFKLNVSTPYDFFFCYLKIANIPLDHGFAYCVQYILELFSFNQRFSCFTSCEIASAAMHLALKYFEWDLTCRIQPSNIFLKNEDVADIVLLMDMQMKELYTSPVSKHAHDIFKRYSTEKYLQVSKEIKGRVIETKV